MSEIETVELNGTLVGAVVELIDFYSKKGVFKINEYKDIASITEKLTVMKDAYDNNKEVELLSLNELAFIVQIFKEGSLRVPTHVESFGQIYTVYQHFTKILEQEVENEKKKKESK
jgi:hypothetical protein